MRDVRAGVEEARPGRNNLCLVLLFGREVKLLEDVLGLLVDHLEVPRVVHHLIQLFPC